MLSFAQLLKRFSWDRPVHPALRENQEFFYDFAQGRPLHEYRFTVCDTELTGLHKRRDQVISIGAVQIENLQIDPSASFHRYIRPDAIQPNEATLIHRITPEVLEEAAPMEEVLPEFIHFCGRSLLVGHFIGLDMHFLNKAARSTLGGALSNPGIDTMRLARRYKESKARDFFGTHDHSGGYHLDALVEEFQLPKFKPHDALEDALQTAYLFLYLLKKFRDGGIDTLKDLYLAGRVRR